MNEKREASTSSGPASVPGLFDTFTRFADHSHDAIYHYAIDVKRFLFHNRKFRSFFGLAREDATPPSSKTILRTIHPEDRPRLIDVLERSMRGQATDGEAEYRVLYPDGSLRWLHDRWIVVRDAQGNAIAFQGFIRDNTQLKLSELQFIGSKQNALIGSYIVHHGRFEYVNPKFVAITGYSEEELVGTDSLKLVHEDYREHVRQHATTMLKGEDLSPYEFCVVDKSGALHWVMETVTSVNFRGERSVLGYFMDITKLHELRDNLSTLGLMLGTISHSLRGCLTGLNAGLYQVETGFYRNRSAHIEEGLDLSKLMVDRVRKLVLDILYYAKERDLEIEAVEVWRFAKEVSLLLERRIKAADIDFYTDFHHDAGFMEVDPEIVRTALINILENAMEACIEDRRPVAHRIDFATRADETHVHFTIADNGPGMEAAEAKEIFKLFSSSKGKRGTGIGLFVTHKAILKHGGDITVVSAPGEGATFRVTLPRKPRPHHRE